MSIHLAIYVFEVMNENYSEAFERQSEKNSKSNAMPISHICFSFDLQAVSYIHLPFVNGGCLTGNHKCYFFAAS